MKPRFATRILVITTPIALLAIIGTIWFLSRSQDRMLQAKFDQLRGYDRDPVIQLFRDSGQEAVAFLARKMESKDTIIRVRAVKALRQMRPPFTASDVGVAALCAALNQPDDEVSGIAEGALGDLGPQAKAAVPALIKSVSGRTDINGVWALGRIGPDAKAALPVLESKMRQETGRERVYAAGAVLEIGGDNAEARAIVEKALEDPDPHIRIDAENVLVKIRESSSRCDTCRPTKSLQRMPVERLGSIANACGSASLSSGVSCHKMMYEDEHEAPPHGRFCTGRSHSDRYPVTGADRHPLS